MELHSSFVLAMIIIFTPVIFADWTKYNPPKKPDPGTKLSCVGWITFYNFDPENPDHNCDMARRRDHKYDRTVFLWTASYVYILSRSKKNRLSPKVFCDNRGMFERTLLPFSKLENEERTCEEWILFYGYDPDINRANHKKSKIRSKKMDLDISMWAAGYARMISTDKFNLWLPSDYCNKMGVTNTKIMDFMTYSSTLFACEDWIKLYDYTDDPLYNYNKVVNTYDTSLDLHLNRFVLGYATDLLARGQDLAIPPGPYCRMQRDGTEKTFYFSEEMMEAIRRMNENE